MRGTQDEGGRRRLRLPELAPGFAAGAGCALHVLANRLGESYIDTKPDVCWQLPIRRDYTWVQDNDGTQKLVITITEYVRGMWGEGGHDFDWYCSSNTEAHIAAEPLYLTNRAELIALIGEPAYDELAIHCQAHIEARRALTLTPVGPLAPLVGTGRPSGIRELTGASPLRVGPPI